MRISLYMLKQILTKNVALFFLFLFNYATNDDSYGIERRWKLVVSLWRQLAGLFGAYFFF